ncbi:MAG: phosphorylcholine transferase LicD [Lachnospira sp.]
MGEQFDKEMKSMLTNMMGWFHQFCVENNIRYYVLGGTMLGAARHQGFIPWDDDIDVGLPRPDYNKMIGLLKNRKEGKYILETPYDGAPDFYYTYSKIYDTETTLTEHTRTGIKRGLFLDVFPLDGVCDDLEQAKNDYKIIDKSRRFLIARTTGIRKGRSKIKNVAVLIARAIPFTSDKKLLIKVDSLCKRYNFDNSSYVGNLMSPWQFREIVPREVFGTPTIYKFESIEVFGMEDANAYLTSVYGDWKKLPPEEKRVTHHDFASCDLHKSYISNAGV